MSSILVAVFITALKLIVGLKTNSLGILSEAAHSGLDLLAAIITYVAVTIADRPADTEHHYGHGKVENVSALLETVLLVLTCSWIIWEAVGRLVAGQPHVEASAWGFVVIGLAIVLDIGRSRALGRVARKHKSQALEADALHFSSDVWSSLVVIIGLGCVRFGYVWVDSIAAITVAFLVLFVSYRLGRRTIDALMDRTSTPLYQGIKAIVASVEGVLEVRHIRVRTTGSTVFVDTTIAVRRATTFEQVHRVTDAIESAIQAKHPEADVVVHAEPVKPGDESLDEQIRMICIERGHPEPHDITVLRVQGLYHVTMHIACPVGTPFEEAHLITHQIEQTIYGALPSIKQITVHVDEDRPVTPASDVTTEHRLLKERICAFVAKQPSIKSCKSVTLLKTDDGMTMALSCRIERSKTLEETGRIVSDLKKLLHTEFGDFRSITIHAEPD